LYKSGGYVTKVIETMSLGISSIAGAPIYDECFLIWQNFVVISIEHCDREANKVAHKLARIGLSLKDNCIWVDEPPSSILETMVNDVVSI
jgi:hypothetical protein